MKLDFQKLEAEDLPKLQKYFNLRSNLTCDSTIFDSYLWGDFYKVDYVIVDDDILLMRMEEEGVIYGGVPLCDEAHAKEGFRILEDYFENELGRGLRIYDADENSLRLMEPDPDRYVIREQPDHADYIYDGQALRTLAGKKYHKKKNNSNAFRKAYEGRWEYRRLGPESQDEIWEFMKRWKENREGDVEEHLSAEIGGLKKVLKHWDEIGAVMAGIYIDGLLEAFTIGTYNSFDRMSVVHVEKANGDIRGLYTVINQEFQAREFPDALLVNREDDVGIPSLRKAKESYHPVMMARKYDLAPRREETSF